MLFLTEKVPFPEWVWDWLFAADWWKRMVVILVRITGMAAAVFFEQLFLWTQAGNESSQSIGD